MNPRTSLLAVAVLAAASSVVAASLSVEKRADGTTRGPLALTSGFDYSTGDYGYPWDTDIFSVPLIATYGFDRWTFRASTAFLTIEGPADASGLPARSVPASARLPDATDSGPGDLFVGATYQFDPLPNNWSWDATAKVKLPTADEDKGLGTGEMDLYVQADFYREMGAFMPFATAGVRFLGDNQRYRMKSGLYLSLGSTYTLTAQSRIGASLDWRQRAIERGDHAAELTIFGTHKIDNHWKGQVYVLKGFSDASPDFGFGANVTYTF